MIEEKNNLKAWLYLAPAMLLLIVFTFYPLFNAFFLAFVKDFNAITRSTYGEDGYSFVLWDNFERVFNNPNFAQAVKNTGMIMLVSVPASILMSLLISVALNSIKKFQGFLQTVFFLPYVTNSIAIGMTFAFIFHSDYGLVNMFLDVFGVSPIVWVGPGASWGAGMTALLIYTVWGGLAFKILVFLSGLQSIDKQYYDAAKIDATPKWRVFSKITVPLLSPMIAYITITSFMGSAKAYSTIVGMFGPNYGPEGNDRIFITFVGMIYDAIAAGTIGSYSVAASAAIILFLFTLMFTIMNMWISKKKVHY
ncbi:MAG: sugar ABC transporter permease [Candidatus Izemoplasma sp.]